MKKTAKHVEAPKPAVDKKAVLPSHLSLNYYVRYYNQGWRVGILTDFKDGLGIIQPSVAYHAGKPRPIKVHPSDIVEAIKPATVSV